MKQKIIMRFMGLDVILSANFPEEIQEKENYMIKLAEKKLIEIIKNEFSIPDEAEIERELLLCLKPN